MRETDAVYDEGAWSKLPEYGKLQQDQPCLDYLLCALLKRDCEEGESVLDVGCGSGRLAFQFKSGYTGIDITPSYVQMARERFPNLTWVEGDCRALPFPDESFDRTWSSNLLIHLPWDDISLALKEMARVTRKAIYLSSTFDDSSDVKIITDVYRGLHFIQNTIDFNYVQVPGWTLHKVGDGKSYVILRKSLPDEGDTAH